MSNNQDHYAALGVTPDAEDIVIRAAYKALAQRYHPDKAKGDPMAAQRKMQAINVAHDVLSDPKQRQSYDAVRQRTSRPDTQRAEAERRAEDAARQQAERQRQEREAAEVRRKAEEEAKRKAEAERQRYEREAREREAEAEAKRKATAQPLRRDLKSATSVLAVVLVVVLVGVISHQQQPKVVQHQAAALHKAEAERLAQVAAQQQAAADEKRKAEAEAARLGREAEAEAEAARLAREAEAETEHKAEVKRQARKQAEAKYKADAETARLAQSAEVERQIAKSQRDPTTDMKLVLIPEGCFAMGDESSQHVVCIEKPFYLGKTEVTQAQWEAVMGNNPSEFKGANLPVEQVSWDDIQTFIGKLNAQTGKRYRLPSEAEWEYAARAGSTTAYPWGSTASREYANYGKDKCCGGFVQGRDQWENTSQVGSFTANVFGLHDMHGNVWEWVQDCWHGSYAGAPIDGSAWVTSCSENSYVLRGGSWRSNSKQLRSAYRFNSAPVGRLDSFGFRLAASSRGL